MTVFELVLYKLMLTRVAKSCFSVRFIVKIIIKISLTGQTIKTFTKSQEGIKPLVCI